MTSPGSGDLYGMTDEQLVSIINATTDHIGQMHQVRANVDTQAGAYIGANNSDSGRIMTQKLDQWTADFYKVVGNLDQLNQKVTGVRQNNLTHNDLATGRAQGH